MSFHLVVAYNSYRHQKTGTRPTKKLLYAAWRVDDNQTEIRESHRLCFGNKSSYRQLDLARIRTCTTAPMRLLLCALIALVMRKAWVWPHFTSFATGENGELKPHLECRRFRCMRMLNWISRVITNLLHVVSHDTTQIPAR